MRVERGFVFKYRSKNKKGAAKWNGFQYCGKTRNGVPRWVGSWDKPPLWFTRIFMGWGLLAGSAGFSLLLWRLLSSDPKIITNPGFGVLIMIGLLHGAIFGGMGWWLLGLRRRIASLSPQDELCERLQVDETRLQEIAEEKGIKPKLNINDRDFYDLNDFSQAQTLLRASNQPTTQPEMLLRAAAPYAQRSASDDLLRASSLEEESEVDLDKYLSRTRPEQTVIVGNGNFPAKE